MADLSFPPLLRWETDTRYYAVRIQRDLFGDLILTRYWGGKDSHRGGEKREPCVSEDFAYDRLEKIKKDRQRHGYNLVVPRMTHSSTALLR